MRYIFSLFIFLVATCAFAEKVWVNVSRSTPVEMERISGSCDENSDSLDCHLRATTIRTGLSADEQAQRVQSLTKNYREGFTQYGAKYLICSEDGISDSEAAARSRQNQQPLPALMQKVRATRKACENPTAENIKTLAAVMVKEQASTCVVSSRPIELKLSQQGASSWGTWYVSNMCGIQTQIALELMPPKTPSRGVLSFTEKGQLLTKVKSEECAGISDYTSVYKNTLLNEPEYRRCEAISFGW